MSYDAAISAKVIDLLRNHISGNPVDPSQTKEMLASLGRDIDRATNRGQINPHPPKPLRYRSLVNLRNPT